MPYMIGEVEVVNEVSLAPSAVLRDGAIEHDCTSDLAIKVNPFFWNIGGTNGCYPGAFNVPVVDDDENFVYLDMTGALQVTTAGYPAMTHIRLGRVITQGGFIVRIILERAFFSTPGNSPGLQSKAGKLIPGNFSGNPKKAVVAFTGTYPDTNYTITLGVETINDVGFAPFVETKLATGFTVNLGGNNLSSLVEVLWQAMPVGE